MTLQDGILLIHKDTEMTSFLCCAIARRLLGVKKVGHAGTLDPNATGVLPLLVGRATKALDLLPRHDKRYTATLRFGAVSDTLDVWGAVKETHLPAPSRAEIEAVLPQFRGDIMQIPPMTSALKKDGVRLYDLARQGIEIKREARPITVHSLDILAYDEASGVLTLDCHCSKGTYIRSICDDLGRILGCGAVMTALCRTMAAGYHLADCITIEEAKSLAQNGTLAARLLPIESAFITYPTLTVTAAQAVRFRNGGALALERLKDAVNGPVRVCDPDGVSIALGIPADNELKMECLF
ncbi:MAG: tRNA pseudouridine(55) synthase TruB [Clostridia bacterium]|nr:tRNA pseudouridine(55) synthase TruB [Clostridia bacterium]